MTNTECALVERLQSGESGVLGELFEMHKPRLRIVLRTRLDRRLLGRVDVEDLLQETYLSAAQRLDHYRKNPTETFFLWLRLIAVQTIIDVHRHHMGTQRRDAKREVSLVMPVDSREANAPLASLELLARITTPSQMIVRAETAAQIGLVLETLSETDREILVMRHFEELTNSEVAQLLGLQPQAASIRYIRALRRLKDALAELSGFMPPPRDREE